MPFHSHRKLTAWLGLIAIWLGLLMPIASQSVQRHHNHRVLDVSYCSSSGTQDLHITLPDPKQGDHSSHGWQACGYCSLLALHMPLPHAAARQTDAPDRYIPTPVATRVGIHLPLPHTPAFPRAPPFLFS
jgi:hypothetical protein